jgi:transposase
MAAEQDRPDVAARRDAWRHTQESWNPEQLVFLDETWAKTNLSRTHGRAPSGQRLIAKVPHGHWKTTTFLAGLRTTGWVAPLVIDGALNGVLFLNYVQQHLVPSLASGDILILDNLSSHKVRGVRTAIESVGAHVLYLPPYSPDLNPIELAFSKLRRLLRSLAVRTVEGLWQACGTVLQAFSPTEIRNYFRHAGYRYT